ncbi:hypothetical protein CRENBAI_021165 [Crenichthys baileyi]|uniref:Uncharacterized protein n=1 Tax=Crenichthys baileyi TaxID=28760 RepID=A0AAV9SNZ2_9TELE
MGRLARQAWLERKDKTCNESDDPSFPSRLQRLSSPANEDGKREHPSSELTVNKRCNPRKSVAANTGCAHDHMRMLAALPVLQLVVDECLCYAAKSCQKL